VPAGSLLIISHAACNLFPVDIGAFEESLNKHLPEDLPTARTRDAVARFIDAMELLEPGVVRVSEWHPEPHEDAHAHTTLWGGAGRKR
jgi:S-adenosyl methyltransferase